MHPEPPSACEQVLEGNTPSMGTFIAVCSEQLKFAIEDSRKEMDGLTMTIVDGGAESSTDVITRLQSIDRFMQRLSNVQLNLDYLAAHLSAGSSDAEVEALMEKLRSTFTMSSERDLFDAMTGYQPGTPTHSDDEMVLF